MLKTMKQWLRRCEPQAYATLCDVVVHVSGFRVELLKQPPSILSKTVLNAEHEIPSQVISISFVFRRKY